MSTNAIVPPAIIALCVESYSSQILATLSMVVNEKRTYDATKRQERAALERRQTRNKVVEAAAALFAERGFVATTVQDIADHAGVALQSVYKAGGSKAELLRLAAEFAVAGDHEVVLIRDRGPLVDLGREPDLDRQLQALARFISTTIDRAMPIMVAQREAAAVDAGAAAELRASELRRLDTFRGIAKRLHLEGITAEEAAVTLWSVAAPDVALQQRRTLGWSKKRHAAWLGRVLPRALGRGPSSR
jgi:AcrR family transcriptional regulator